jgi:hypothetical protein
MVHDFRKVMSAALAAVAGTLLSAAAPAPAAAQFFYDAPYHRPHFFRPFFGPQLHRPPVIAEELTPGEVAAVVRDHGFRDASRPRFEDDVALVTATDRNGNRLRLSIDLYSGRIVETEPVRPQRERQVQRAPDQGGAVRRGVPETREDVRAAPDRPPTTVRREPMLPPQPQQEAKPPPRPAQPPTAGVAPGTKAQPRRIEITPPAALDDVKRPPAPAAPAGPPINSVPPAALE